MATFKSSTTRNLGATPTTIFTAISGTVVIGLSVSNIFQSELPVDVWHHRGSDSTYIFNQVRIGPGETLEVMKGNKIVLQTGDTLVASTALANGFDILVSVLEGV